VLCRDSHAISFMIVVMDKTKVQFRISWQHEFGQWCVVRIVNSILQHRHILQELVVVVH